MKLFVIVLCLLSERYLVHQTSLNRAQLFHWYMNTIEKYCSSVAFLKSPWVLFLTFLVPLLVVVCFVNCLLQGLFYGLWQLLFNILVFYLCIGPENPFYPFRQDNEKAKPSTKASAAQYLVDLNTQLFAVIFWYVFLGPVGALGYRIISLSRSQAAVAQPGALVSDLADWIPARITALFYLLVGNFQAGFPGYITAFLTPPSNNAALLKACGTTSLQTASESKKDFMAQAEQLAFHALIMILALLGCFVIASRF